MDYMKATFRDEDIDIELDNPLHVKSHDPCLAEYSQKNEPLDNTVSDDSLAAVSLPNSPYHYNDGSDDYNEILLGIPQDDMFYSVENCDQQNTKMTDEDSNATNEQMAVNEAIEESADIMIAYNFYSSEIEVQSTSNGSASGVAEGKRKRGRPPKNLPHDEKVVNRRTINKKSAEKYRAKKSSEYKLLLREEAMEQEKNQRLRESVKQLEQQIKTYTAMIPDHMKEIVDRLRQNNNIEL